MMTLRERVTSSLVGWIAELETYRRSGSSWEPRAMARARRARLLASRAFCALTAGRDREYVSRLFRVCSDSPWSRQGVDDALGLSQIGGAK